MRQITVKTVDRKTTFTREQVRAAIRKVNAEMGLAGYGPSLAVEKKKPSKTTGTK